MSRKNHTQAYFQQIRGNLVSVGLCVFRNLTSRADGSNCTYKSAAQGHSPLQVSAVALATPVASPRTEILSSSVSMLRPKARFRQEILKIILKS